MIGLRVDLNTGRIEISKDATHVCLQVGADILAEKAFPVFGGEDEMDVNLGEGLRHARLLSPFRALVDLLRLPREGHKNVSLPGLTSGGPSGRDNISRILKKNLKCGPTGRRKPQSHS